MKIIRSIIKSIFLVDTAVVSWFGLRELYSSRKIIKNKESQALSDEKNQNDI